MPGRIIIRLLIFSKERWCIFMEQKEKKSIGKLFLSMVKIGCIGFGGGNALIPIMQQELVVIMPNDCDEDDEVNIDIE